MRYVWVIHEYHTAVLCKKLDHLRMLVSKEYLRRKSTWLLRDDFMAPLSPLRGVYICFSSILVFFGPEVCKNYFVSLFFLHGISRNLPLFSIMLFL